MRRIIYSRMEDAVFKAQGYSDAKDRSRNDIEYSVRRL